MISEKTVELNLTTEMINWLSRVTPFTHFALAPSQRQEEKLGFDAGVGSCSSGIFIQYKRAYKTKAGRLTWHLNRTKNKDQLAKLKALEAAGFQVLFAFPHFTTASEIEIGRRRLLLMTSWIEPSLINPKGGPDGHHEVHFDPATSKWWVSSDEPTPIEGVKDHNILRTMLDRPFQNRETIASALSSITETRDSSLLAGASVLGRGRHIEEF